MKFYFTTILLCLVLCGVAFGQNSNGADEDYLTWNMKQVEAIGQKMRKNGKVGSRFSVRGINTERAINYKLRATLMSSEMIRASARYQQLLGRLSNEETRKLVEEAENAAELVVMVEIDPNEGSGVIPLDWRAIIQPKGLKEGEAGSITGRSVPSLKFVKALNGVFKRKYDYDVFFVSFPLVGADGNALIADDVSQIELIVGIYSREGTIEWSLPGSVREKMERLVKKGNEEND
ncbi:MAG: hypothetical protein R2684_17495 [Pyrinomonadaceae bacterium]